MKITEDFLKSNTIPLIHVVDEDDLVLSESADAVWFTILSNFPWSDYVGFAADYYDALYQFNLKEAEKRSEKGKSSNEGSESEEEAALRLLFDRATMQKTKEGKIPVLFEQKVEEIKTGSVDVNELVPGRVPERFAGRKPKCFFAMFKAFLGTSLMGLPPEPEHVYMMLSSNPSFLRVCGFVLKMKNKEYSHLHVPSLRKLEQFDQIMTLSGLWDKIKLQEVKSNLEDKTIKYEKELVGDTTHYHAYSGFETVEYHDENGKECKKSQSKTTKKCRCENRETCSHDWTLADDGAGTVVKSNNKMHWAHKASIIGFPVQGIPLDARAVSDASTNDGLTFYPHVKSLFEMMPELASHVGRVLYDSACCSKELKKKFHDDLGVMLKASFNPRRKGNVTVGLPRGIELITPYGEPRCFAGYSMEYIGIRYENDKFIYRSPFDADGEPVCNSCEMKEYCSPNSETGRTITISFDALPQIDPNDPPMSKRFKAIMTRRPSVERMIKRLKRDLGDDRLTKRGNSSFQAYLDKTMIAYHILLRY